MALVGDPERRRAEATLRRHFVAGRLSGDELSERLELVLRARTGGDLRRALRSLPPAWRQVDDVILPAVAGARRTVRVAATFVVWAIGSLFLLLAFAGWLVAEGPSAFGLVAFPLGWLVLSAALYVRLLRPRR